MVPDFREHYCSDRYKEGEESFLSLVTENDGLQIVVFSVTNNMKQTKRTTKPTFPFRSRTTT